MVLTAFVLTLTALKEKKDRLNFLFSREQMDIENLGFETLDFLIRRKPY